MAESLKFNRRTYVETRRKEEKMLKLDGKVAVVTGGSSGIGLADERITSAPGSEQKECC
jgi:hypothetical protein